MEIFNRKKYFLSTLVIILPDLDFSLMTGPVNIPGEFNDAVFYFRKIIRASLAILGANAYLFLFLGRSDLLKKEYNQAN